MHHLEMQMRAGRIARAANRPNDRALEHALPAANADGAQMCVQGLPAVAVIDHHHVAVAPVIPTRIHHHAIISGIDRIAGLSVDVDPQVVGARAVIEAGQEMVVRGPNEGANTDGPIRDGAAGASGIKVRKKE